MFFSCKLTSLLVYEVGDFCACGWYLLCKFRTGVGRKRSSRMYATKRESRLHDSPPLLSIGVGINAATDRAIANLQRGANLLRGVLLLMVFMLLLLMVLMSTTRRRHGHDKERQQERNTNWKKQKQDMYSMHDKVRGYGPAPLGLVRRSIASLHVEVVPTSETCQKTPEA